MKQVATEASAPGSLEAPRAKRATAAGSGAVAPLDRDGRFACCRFPAFVRHDCAQRDGIRTGISEESLS